MIRPWQQDAAPPQVPDEPRSVMGRVLKAHFKGDLKGNLNATAKEWDDAGKRQVEFGNYPPMSLEETAAFQAEQMVAGANFASHRQDEIYSEFVNDLHERYPKEVAKIAQVEAHLAIGGAIGNMEKFEADRAALGENQQKLLGTAMADFDYMRRHPMSVSASRDAEHFKEVIARGYEAGKLPLLKKMVPFLKTVDPKTAEMLAGAIHSAEMSAQAVEVWGVGNTAGANLFAMHLGFEKAGVAKIMRSGSKNQKSILRRVGKKMLRAVDDAGGLPWLDEGFKGKTWREHMLEAKEGSWASEQAWTRFYVDSDAREILSAHVGEERSEKVIEMASNGELGREQLFALGRGLSEMIDEKGLTALKGDNPEEALAAAMNVEGGGLPRPLMILFDALAVGTRAVGGAVDAFSDKVGVYGFAFSDGEVLTDSMEAALKYATLVEMGADPGRHPDVERAIRNRHRELGLTWNKNVNSYGLMDAATQALNWAGSAADRKDFRGQRMFAAPMPLLAPSVEAGGAAEAWQRVRGAFTGDGEFFADVMIQSSNVGRVGGTVDKTGAYIAEAILDPLNLLGGGSLTATRSVIKAQVRIGKEVIQEIGDTLTKKTVRLLEGADASLAKGYETKKFADGARMKADPSARANLISKLFGGGEVGDAIAVEIITEVKKNPALVVEGTKKAFVDRMEAFGNYLRLAPDGRVRQAAQKAAAFALKAGKTADEAAEIAQQAGQKAFRRIVDEALPVVDTIVAGMERTVLKPLYKGGAIDAAKMGDRMAANAGIRFGIAPLHASFSISPLTRAFNRRVAPKIKGAINDTTLGRLAGKLVSPVGRKAAWVAGVFSPTHWHMQVGGETVKIPTHLRRLYRMSWGRVNARVTEQVPRDVAELFLRGGERKWGMEKGAKRAAHWMQRPGTAKDRRILTHILNHMPDVGTSPAAIAEALGGASKHIPDLGGKSATELLPKVEELMDYARSIREELDRIYSIEVSLGLQSSMVSDGYVPVLSRGGIRREGSVIEQVNEVQGKNVSGGAEREAGMQIARKTEDKIYIRNATGAVVEDDIAAIMMHRLAEHHFTVNANAMLGSLSTAVGVPVVKGKRAAMEFLAANSRSAERASALWRGADIVNETARDRASYARMQGELKSQLAYADGARKSFKRMKSKLGLGSLALLDRKRVLAALDSPEALASLASKGDKFWDDVIPDEMLREQVRAAAKGALDASEAARRLRANAGKLGMKAAAFDGPIEGLVAKITEELGENLPAAMNQSKGVRKGRAALDKVIQGNRVHRLEAATRHRLLLAQQARITGREARLLGAEASDAVSVSREAREALIGLQRKVAAKERELGKLIPRIRNWQSGDKHRFGLKALENAEGLTKELESLHKQLNDRVDAMTKATRKARDAGRVAEKKFDIVKLRELNSKRQELEKLIPEARAALNSWDAIVSEGLKGRSRATAALADASKSIRGIRGDVKRAVREEGKQRGARARLLADAQDTLQMREVALDLKRHALRSPAMEEVAEGVAQFSRRAANAEGTVRELIGKMAALQGYDAIDRRAAAAAVGHRASARAAQGKAGPKYGVVYEDGVARKLKRSDLPTGRAGELSPLAEGAARGGKSAGRLTEELTGSVVYEGGKARTLKPWEARAYQEAQDMMADAGIEGELLGAVLWDMHGVTKITELPLRDAIALARSGEPTMRLQRVMRKPVRDVGAVVVDQASHSRAWDAMKKLGFTPTGTDAAESLLDAADHIDALRVAARAGDKEANRLLGQFAHGKTAAMELAFRQGEIPKWMDKTHDVAGGAHRLQQGAEVGRYNPNPAHRGDHVRALTGKTAAGRELENILVPLDVGLAMRSMLGEKVGDASRLAQANTVGLFGKLLGDMTRFWKSVVTDSMLGPAFAMRQKIDSVMAQVQIGMMDMFIPSNRKELRQLVDGTIDGIQVADGWMSREEFLELYASTVTGIGGRFDVNDISANLARGDLQRDTFAKKMLEEAALHRRGTAGDLGKQGSRISAKSVTAGMKGGSVGALVGIALGGPLVAATGFAGGYAMGMARKSLKQGGPAGSGGRIMPTLSEYLLPVHGAGAQVNEDYVRAMTLLYNRKRGLGAADALDKTLLQMRDYSNYKAEEKVFIQYAPVIFYNFTKQNTIAQITRLMDRPGFGALQAKVLTHLSDDLPEDMRPAWMAQLNSAIIGGKAYYMPFELTHPFEVASALGLLVRGEWEQAAGMLTPVLRDTIESKIGPKRLPTALAESLYNRHGGPVEMRGLKVGVTEDGKPFAEVSTLGQFFLLASGLDVVARNVGRGAEHVEFGQEWDTAIQFLFNIKAYRLSPAQLQKLARGGQHQEAMEELADLFNGIGVEIEGGVPKFFAEMSPGFTNEEWAALKEIAQTLNGGVGMQFSNDIADLLRSLQGTSTSQRKQAATK